MINVVTMNIATLHRMSLLFSDQANKLLISYIYLDITKFALQWQSNWDNTAQ